jgi:hypothetical protein
MGKGFEKRKRIFDKYIFQLQKLNENKLLPDFISYNIGSYICPICLNQFTEKDLNEESINMLTLEDAPPKSLGGRASTLTCKNCNNKCGHEIDFHLTERLIELDERAFLPNTKTQAHFTHNGIKIKGEINIDNDGVFTTLFDKKNNHPEKFEKYFEATGKGDISDLEFRHSRVAKHRLEVALLKTAYILAFEQYGYTLILSHPYDIVREQLLNPDIELYPEGFWTKQNSFAKKHEGVHLITSRGLEGFLAIFSLMTVSSEKLFGVYLPISVKTTNDVIARFRTQKGGFGLTLDSLFMNNYYEDTENMKQMTNYIKSKNIS